MWLKAEGDWKWSREMRGKGNRRASVQGKKEEETERKERTMNGLIGKGGGRSLTKEKGNKGQVELSQVDRVLRVKERKTKRR